MVKLNKNKTCNKWEDMSYFPVGSIHYTSIEIWYILKKKKKKYKYLKCLNLKYQLISPTILKMSLSIENNNLNNIGIFQFSTCFWVDKKMKSFEVFTY